MSTADSQDIVSVLLLSLGIFFLGQGILMRLGILKYWFATKRVPTLVIPDFAFGLIPVGLALVVLGLTPKMDWLVSIFMGLGVVFTLWTPRWLKPAWLCWLEDNYGDLMPQLRQDAQRIGRWQWQRMVRTQEGLERWAESVRQRHLTGSEPPK